MPKGKPLPNMMDNEIVQVFYSVIKNSSETDFGTVAKELDLKDAGAAKARLQRMMKAQEKTGPAPKADGGKAKAAGGGTKAAADGEAKKPAGRPKKRKAKGEELKEELEEPEAKLKGLKTEKSNGVECESED